MLKTLELENQLESYNNFFFALLNKIENYQEMPGFAKKILFQNINKEDLNNLDEGEGISFVFMAFGRGENVQSQFLQNFLKKLFPKAVFKILYKEDYIKQQKSFGINTIPIALFDYRETVNPIQARNEELPIQMIRSFPEIKIRPSMLQLKLLNTTFIEQKDKEEIKKLILNHPNIPENIKTTFQDALIIVTQDHPSSPSNYYRDGVQKLFEKDIQQKYAKIIVISVKEGQLNLKFVEDGDMHIPFKGINLVDLEGKLILKYLYSISDLSFVPSDCNKLEPLTFGPIFGNPGIYSILNPNNDIDETLKDKIFLLKEIEENMQKLQSFSLVTDIDREKMLLNLQRDLLIKDEPLIQDFLPQIIQKIREIKKIGEITSNTTEDIVSILNYAC